MTQQYTDHHVPVGANTRGTVVVVPGRGESRATYDRFGKRLAADAYRVRVVDAPEPPEDQLDGWLGEFAAHIAEAVRGAEPTGDVVHPLVLVGSDTGAAALAALSGRPATRGPRPDALVLAGLPGPAAADAGSWEEELDLRTTCPVHREALTRDAGVRRGTLAAPVPGWLLDSAHGAAGDIPHLLLVGDRDPLADRDAVGRLAKSLPVARLAVVHGAHHDVLNDQQHRSVAAEIVLLLEALRGGRPTPLITTETSSW
ncbi:alpha/beta hydrolase [Streptomyces longispororuber]|uniref:alpha/beta hydrolase n=1 Tax=Streptomyces longispororuber TaxID=68230 RepID=UPI00210B66F7|nr:lysophospholipase [Streptomyces longispororuber]MCQ4213016.1 lysophospholipase [Streptomyces longispororuber]